MISFQIKSRVSFGLPYLLIELFYISMPVMRTDGRAGGRRLVGRSVGVRSRDYQMFFGWVDYHIFLAMGLRPRVQSSAVKDSLHVTWNFLESFQLSDFNEMQSKITWDFT